MRKIYIIYNPICKIIADSIIVYLKKNKIDYELQNFNKDNIYYDNRLYFIICSAGIKNLPKNYILFNTEQYNSVWFKGKKHYKNHLKNSLAIFDYSTKNLEYLKKHYENKKLIYFPISFNKNYYPKIKCYKFNLFFCGVMNSRRRKILKKINKYYDIKVITKNCFGKDLDRELDKANIVLNIHYYKKNVLETTRIYESLSHGCLVISEKSDDYEIYKDLKGLVDFVDQNNFEGIISRIRYWHNNPIQLKKRILKIERNIKKEKIGYNKKLLKQVLNIIK